MWAEQGGTHHIPSSDFIAGDSLELRRSNQQNGDRWRQKRLVTTPEISHRKSPCTHREHSKACSEVGL